MLRSLVELSAGQRGGDWEVVEHEGRFLLKSARWLQGVPDVSQARRRAQDLLDAILGVINALDFASHPKIKRENKRRKKPAMRRMLSIRGEAGVRLR